MDKIDWVRKLSSRKFWALIAALLTAILSGVVSEQVVSHITGIVTAVGACVVYMLAEASVDKARAGPTLPAPPEEQEESDTEY